jgi:hypothetical protein
MGEFSAQLLNKADTLVILTVILSLAFHSTVHVIEHTLKKHKHLLEMWNHLTKELLTLGISSFALFIVQVSGIQLSSEDKHLFEVVHITLFFIVIGYLVISFGLMALSLRISNQWDTLEKHEKKDFVRIEKKLEELAKERKNMSFVEWILSFKFRQRYQKVNSLFLLYSR